MAVASKIICAVMVATISVGCTMNRRGPDYSALTVYSKENRPQAESGTIPWSQYYKGAYSKMLEVGAPGFALAGMNESINTALQYESGKITKDEFDYRRRAIQADMSTRSQQENTRAQEDQSRKEAAGQAAMAAALSASAQMMQLSRPYTIPQSQMPINGLSMTWPLSSQSTSGTLRYCKYSNGAISTINIIDLCPMMGP